MEDLDRWFAEQVLPLEGALTAYLRRVWPDPAEIGDLRQEVYVRIYDAALTARPAVTRYFVFTVARNLLTDRLRRSRIVRIDLMGDLAKLDIFSDEVPIDRVLSGRQELARLEAALAELPERCRETFILRKVEELSQKETAERMGVSEHTVEKQTAKAMRLLADRFWNDHGDDGALPGADDMRARDERRY